MEPYAEVTEQYAGFAAHATESPCFVDWSHGVLEDREVLAWIGSLPEPKQQPNLVFAAARWHGVAAPGPYDGLRRALLGDDGSIRATILARSTQTNEAGRLATLTPALAALGLDAPVALLEVGASAGLCLYPDRYRYEWRRDGSAVSDGPDAVVTAGTGPTLRCEVTGPAPLPSTLPRIAWRGGVDLHPLDVTDDDAMGWLTTLVWPEQEDRRARLEQAIAIARSDPPEILGGDLLTELPAMVERVAERGPVVVFHTAVIAYLEPDDRRRFHAMMTELVAAGRCRWISNEGKRVLPEVTATGPEVPEDLQTFVMGIDGRAVAWTHGHGRSMRWLA